MCVIDQANSVVRILEDHFADHLALALMAHHYSLSQSISYALFIHKYMAYKKC